MSKLLTNFSCTVESHNNESHIKDKSHINDDDVFAADGQHR